MISLLYSPSIYSANDEVKCHNDFRGYFALQKKMSIVHINLLKNFKVANLNTPSEALELGRDNSSKVREFREDQQIWRQFCQHDFPLHLT